MKKQKLTAAALPSLPAGEYTDHLLPGLNLTVGARRKTWSLRHRVGGRLRRDTLGHFPRMGLSDAREAARALAERVETGMPVEPAAVHPRSAAVSVADLIDRYERYRRAKGGRGTRTLADSMKRARRCLKAYLSMPATSFGKHELRAVRDAIARTAPVASNRLLAYVSPVFAWAAQEDLIEVDFSRAVIRIGAETKRERVLSRDEIARIWQACDSIGTTPVAQSYGKLVKLLLLTGQRRAEVAGLRHGAILDGVWRQATNKSDRPHTVPLPPLAMRIVGTGGPRDLAFPGADGKPVGGWSKLKRKLDRLCGVADWTLHDLRRTAASGWQDAGADFLVIETLLNHSLKGVASVYLRGQMAAQKAAVLDAWAIEVERIAGSRRAVS